MKDKGGPKKYRTLTKKVRTINSKKGRADGSDIID